MTSEGSYGGGYEPAEGAVSGRHSRDDRRPPADLASWNGFGEQYGFDAGAQEADPPPGVPDQHWESPRAAARAGYPEAGRPAGYGAGPAAPPTTYGSAPSAPPTTYGSAPSAPPTTYGSAPSAPPTTYGSAPASPGYRPTASVPEPAPRTGAVYGGSARVPASPPAPHSAEHPPAVPQAEQPGQAERPAQQQRTAPPTQAGPAPGRATVYGSTRVPAQGGAAVPPPPVPAPARQAAAVPAAARRPAAYPDPESYPPQSSTHAPEPPPAPDGYGAPVAGGTRPHVYGAARAQARLEEGSEATVMARSPWETAAAEQPEAPQRPPAHPPAAGYLPQGGQQPGTPPHGVPGGPGGPGGQQPYGQPSLPPPGPAPARPGGTTYGAPAAAPSGPAPAYPPGPGGPEPTRAWNPPPTEDPNATSVIPVTKDNDPHGAAADAYSPPADQGRSQEQGSQYGGYGQPGLPAPGGPASTGQEQPAAQPGKGKLVIGIVLALAVVVALSGVAFYLTVVRDTAEFKVGSCVKQQGDSAVLVSCSHAGVYRIDRQVPDKSACNATQPYIVVDNKDGTSDTFCLVAK